MKIQKLEYLEKEKSCLGEIKNIFFTIFEGVLFGEKIKIWQKIADTSFKTLCVNLLSGVTTIRTISQVLGKITISFEATKFGWLHYRNLEVFKTRALKYYKNNFNVKLCLSEEAKGDLRWWKTIFTESIMTLLFPTPQ